ncbi:hypothetical protein E2C01_052082 [Portunus trituberculatus]|uniref:Uncharacterized protein n=1 Tax=Portunus trituberculatus TaxID=210409 RepID=A0A5B7GLE6_PORTR|nr:hypothetical protein [Portunus trituberculatus]
MTVLNVCTRTPAPLFQESLVFLAGDWAKDAGRTFGADPARYFQRLKNFESPAGLAACSPASTPLPRPSASCRPLRRYRLAPAASMSP